MKRLDDDFEKVNAMGRYGLEIWVTPLANGTDWRLVAPFWWESAKGFRVSLNPGFVTNFASVPQLFWNLLPSTGRYDGAAALHDWLYGAQVLTRKQSDDVLMEAMEDGGVDWLTRWAIYSQVRLWGWTHWPRVPNPVAMDWGRVTPIKNEDA